MHPKGAVDMEKTWAKRAAFVTWLADYQVDLHIGLLDGGLNDHEQLEKQAADPDGLIVTRRPAPCLGKRREPSACHALVEMGTMLFCRKCGHWAQHRMAKLAGPCEGLRDHAVYKLRRDRLLAGIHPVSREPLPEVGRSWIGRLVDEWNGRDDAQGNAVWESGPNREEAAEAAHSHMFLAGHLPTAEQDFDRHLAAFIEAIPSVIPSVRRGKDAQHEDDF